MEVKNEISIDEMKKIAYEIIEEVSKKENVNINAFPVTIGEYYNEKILKKKLSLGSLMNVVKPFVANGFNDLKGNAFIFFENTCKFKRIESSFFKLVRVCYHEACHTVQQKFDVYNYDGFLRRIDGFLQGTTLGVDYFFFHDNYSYEIGANLYAVSNAKRYLIEKYPEMYNKYKDEIEQLERKYTFDYLTYDASDTFERFIDMARKIDKIKLYVNDKKLLEFGLSHKELEGLKNVLDIFMKDINQFKEIKEIIHDENFKLVDSKIVSVIFSSKSFLDSVDIEKLNNEELEVLHNALQYTNNVYQNQVDFIEKSYKEDAVTLKECLKKQSSLLKKINIIYTIMRKNNRNLLSKEIIRKETDRLEHRDNVPVYLEKTNKLIKKKRNSGYSYVYMLFVIGGVISLFTIFYLIIIK